MVSFGIDVLPSYLEVKKTSLLLLFFISTFQNRCGVGYGGILL